MNTVRYIDCIGARVGDRARVIALDHPSAPNREWITTTTVCAIEPGRHGPAFTTRNTLYVPAEPGEEPEENEQALRV